MPALPKGFLAMLQAKSAASKASVPGGSNNPTPGQIPQSVAPVGSAANNASNPLLRTPTYLTVGGQPINAGPQPSIDQQLGSLVAAYNKNPYAALASGSQGRASTSADPAWWLTYGMGPEASFFSNNETPSAAPATPTGAPSSGAPSGTPAPGTGSVRPPGSVEFDTRPVSGALSNALWRSPLNAPLGTGVLAQLSKLGYNQPSPTTRNRTIQPVMGGRT